MNENINIENKNPIINDTNIIRHDEVSDDQITENTTNQNNRSDDPNAPISNAELREMLKHSSSFGEGMNPEALERLMNQPGPDTKALLERMSQVMSIQDENIGKAFTKINEVEKRVNKCITSLSISTICLAIADIILLFIIFNH